MNGWELVLFARWANFCSCLSSLFPFSVCVFSFISVWRLRLLCFLTLPAMASANVTLENQLHSAQKNLLFLQQDHANTLKGLHAEIRRLQQQCTGEQSQQVANSFFECYCGYPAHLRTSHRISETAKQVINVNNDAISCMSPWDRKWLFRTKSQQDAETF